MKQTAIRVATGFAAWSVAWCAANFVAPVVVPDAFAADGTVRGTLVPVAFIAWAALLSLLAGAIAARRPSPGPGAARGLALLLLLVGTMVELSYWAALPAWYHLTFLAVLVPATLTGARLVDGPRRVGAVAST